MKKLILIILLVLTGSFLQLSYSQPCSLANPGVKLNSITTEGSNCRMNIDLYFDMIHNSGGKWFWVHIWPSGAYSDWSYGDPPTVANAGLVGSIATFGVEHQQSDLIIQSSYPPDATAPGFQSSGLSVAVGPGILTGSERYTIKNLDLLIPASCGIPQSYTFDVWESQSAASQNVHCFVKGMDFYANDPTVRGSLQCSVPRHYSFVLETINPSGQDVSFKVFIDNGDGIFNNTTDNIQVNSGSITLDAANQYRYQSPMLDYLPYSGQKPYSDRDLWIEITTPSIPNAIYAHLVNNCIPLPASFKSFAAVRNASKVLLNWITASELNNKGFFIERNVGNSGWQQIGFVPSAATTGNSSTDLSYQFTDDNSYQQGTLYRLRQVDINDEFSFSSTVYIKGLNPNSELLIYPNPSTDGTITILTGFAYDVTVRLYDMRGQLLREWNTTGRYNIGELTPGIYIIKAINRGTGEVSQGKLLITR